MNNSINSKDLNTMISLEKKLNKKSNLPILRSIKANNQGLTVTNLDTLIMLRGEYPNFVIPSARLGKYTGSVEYSIKNDVITLVNGLTQDITLNKYDDFPMIDINEGYKISYRLKTEIINHLIDISYACSTDETRYAITGICLNKNGISVTDGRRLHYVKYPLSFLGDQSITIKKEFIDILKSLKIKSEYFTIAINDKKAKFTVDNYVLLTTLIDAQYPNITAVMPKFYDNSISINRIELLSFLNEAKKIFKKDIPRVQFQFKIDQGSVELNIKAKNGDQLNKTLNISARKLNCYTKNINLYPDYLIDIMESESMAHELNITFLIQGGIETDFGYITDAIKFEYNNSIVVLMPMRD